MSSCGCNELNIKGICSVSRKHLCGVLVPLLLHAVHILCRCRWLGQVHLLCTFCGHLPVWMGCYSDLSFGSHSSTCLVWKCSGGTQFYQVNFHIVWLVCQWIIFSAATWPFLQQESVTLFEFCFCHLWFSIKFSSRGWDKSVRLKLSIVSIPDDSIKSISNISYCFVKNYSQPVSPHYYIYNLVHSHKLVQCSMCVHHMHSLHVYTYMAYQVHDTALFLLSTLISLLSNFKSQVMSHPFEILSADEEDQYLLYLILISPLNSSYDLQLFDELFFAVSHLINMYCMLCLKWNSYILLLWVQWSLTKPGRERDLSYRFLVTCTWTTLLCDMYANSL